MRGRLILDLLAALKSCGRKCCPRRKSGEPRLSHATFVSMETAPTIYAGSDWHFCLQDLNWKCAKTLRFAWQLVFRLHKIDSKLGKGYQQNIVGGEKRFGFNLGWLGIQPLDALNNGWMLDSTIVGWMLIICSVPHADASIVQTDCNYPWH